MVYVLHQSTPRARKAHRCDTCLRAIKPGETYLRQDNVHDGQRYTWMNCAHCDLLVRAVIKVDPLAMDYDEGIDVNEWIRYYAPDYFAAGDELRRLFHARWGQTEQTEPLPLERLQQLLQPALAEGKRP